MILPILGGSMRGGNLALPFEPLASKPDRSGAGRILRLVARAARVLSLSWPLSKNEPRFPRNQYLLAEKANCGRELPPMITLTEQRARSTARRVDFCSEKGMHDLPDCHARPRVFQN